ncbi:MAG: hypothetical protein WC284_10920 [Candidimonas sp.]
MGFTNQERINLNSKVLSAGVIDANEVAVWYESRFPAEFVVPGNKVWTQMSAVRAYPASTLNDAKSIAANNLNGIVQDLSDPSSACHLTPVTGTNGSTLVAYAVFGDPSSPRLDNWIQPQQVPTLSGLASIGYTAILWQGDPSDGGTQISTTDGTTGTGDQKSVGWVFNYANGLLFLSADFRQTIDVEDLWITGFRYVGQTADGLTGGGAGGGTDASFDEISLSHTTGTILQNDHEDFDLPTGGVCQLLELSVDNPCVVECHSTAARNDTNPYQFIAVNGALVDDGSYIISNQRQYGPRYVHLYNLQSRSSGITYWRIFQPDPVAFSIQLNIKVMKIL